MSTEQNHALLIQIQLLDKKFDAFHDSMDGRLAELKADMHRDLSNLHEETKQINGRVRTHDREIATIKGMVAAAMAGLPFVIFALNQLT